MNTPSTSKCEIKHYVKVILTPLKQMEESRTKEGQMCAYQHQLTHHFLLLTAEHTIQF